MSEVEAELDSQLRDRRTAVLERGLERIGSEPVRWLALLPEWTDALAAYCHFPAGEEGLGAFVERAEQLGFCEADWEDDIDGTRTHRFWMPAPVRSALMEHWGLDRGLQEETRKVAARIIDAKQDRPDVVSTGMLRWAQLVGSKLDRGTELIEAVDASLAAGEPGEAGNWITAGKALSEPLGAEMNAAAELAQRRVSFYYRGRQDAEHLRRFIPRQEQIDEVKLLLDPKREHWAVHFIGPGGVGKTMLMRYLTSREDGSRTLSSARLDFDYIDPRYPLESPARLLHELAEELAVDLTDRTQESLFRSFREAVTRAEGVRLDPGNDPLHPLGTGPFEDAVKAFAAFVNELPQPVVLILDTCEELAKLHPPGEDVPSISATFKILERIHEEAPGVKVVFAGRRWLTPEAANEKRDEATPKSVMCMEPRPYMRMLEVRGFTAAEVEEFLAKVCERPPEPAVLSAVLEATADSARAPGFGEDEDNDDPRYNPTDVALLGSWLAEEQTLSPERLAAGNLDRFVEARILGRLESTAVKDAIPAAILLERFDAAMIEPALSPDPEVRAEALNGLLEQEWTHLEGGPALEDIVIRIDGGLLVRLKNYYSRTEARARRIDDTHARLAPHLAALMERAPGGVSVEAIDAAMRLLPLDEAAGSFDRLANRVAESGAWPWAGAVCSRLLSPERKPPLDDRLVASVGALYVAALAQRGSGVSLVPFWTQVATMSINHPDATQAVALGIRGSLGRVAALARDGRIDVHAAAEILANASNQIGRLGAVTPIAPALLAATEALVDACEERACEIPIAPTEECLRVLFDRFGGHEPIQAQIFALEGRLHAANHNRQEARASFAALEGLPLADDPPGPGFVDWVAPSSLRHRALLELLRFRLADNSEGSLLLHRCEKAALDCIDGADAGQLLSLAVQARLARGDRAELEECLPLTNRYEEEVEGYDLVTPAHRVAPPLFVSLAEAMHALGWSGTTLSLLSEREQVAVARRTDEDAARAAALATVRVLRRLRRRERFALIGGSGDDDDDDLRMETLAAGALIAGMQPQSKGRIEDHAVWRASVLLSPTVREETESPIRPDTSRATVASAHQALDRAEWRMLAPRRRRRLLGALSIRREALLVRRVCGREDVVASMMDPLGVGGLRLALRRLALGSDREEAEFRVQGARGRLVGEIALDEGELLALRLPDRALPLLALAARNLAEAGDAHGAFSASLCWAIAAIHCGRGDEAHAHRAEVMRLYEAARRIDPSLPADPAAVPTLDAGTECHWSAWVERLAVFLQWCEKGAPEGVDPSALQLEPEVTLVEAARSLEAPFLADDEERPEADRREDFAEMTLRIAESSYRHGSGPGFEVAVEFLPRSLKSWLLGTLREAMSMLLPGFHSPPTFPLFEGPIGPGAPSRLADFLGSRIERPRLSVRLMVSPGLAGVDWERRLVGHLVSPGGWQAEKLPEMWRVAPSAARPPSLGDWSPYTVPVCSQRWQPLVANSAGPATRLLSPGHGVGRLDAGVAIALGLPALTKAGWRLRLDDDELSVRLEDPGAPRMQELISPDRLATMAPVALIFGRPGGPRLAADPRSAEGLRGFANEAVLAGAYAAVAIPVLPPELAATAIEFATAEISKWELAPAGEELRLLAEGLRAAVAQGVEDYRRHGPATEIEPALDICLFMRE